MEASPQVEKISQYHDLDWSQTLEFSDNNPELAAELVGIFVESLPEDSRALQSAFAEQDFPALQAAAHKLHGALCYVTLPTMKENVRALEHACRAQDEDAVMQYYRAAKANIDDFLAFVAES